MQNPKFARNKYFLLLTQKKVKKGVDFSADNINRISCRKGSAIILNNVFTRVILIHMYFNIHLKYKFQNNSCKFTNARARTGRQTNPCLKQFSHY